MGLADKWKRAEPDQWDFVEAGFNANRDGLGGLQRALQTFLQDTEAEKPTATSLFGLLDTHLGLNPTLVPGSERVWFGLGRAEHGATFWKATSPPEKLNTGEIECVLAAAGEAICEHLSTKGGNVQLRAQCDWPEFVVWLCTRPSVDNDLHVWVFAPENVTDEKPGTLALSAATPDG